MFFTQQNLGQSYGNAPGIMRYLSFAIALNDSGSGAVNTTPDYNLGSGTATYTRNTTAYALFSNGNYGSVAANTARGSYNASGTWLGYQVEGARADVLGVTDAIRRTMTDVGWVASNMTVGTAIGADGVADAGASLTATAGNATILFTTVLGAAVRTYSAWVRRKTGTGTVNITGDNGVTWTPITLTTTYTQFSFTTASAANPVVGFRIVTDTDAIEVDFNTLEQAAFANPTPIPVNVSKAADVLTYPSNGNIDSTNGSVFAEITTVHPVGGTNIGICGTFIGGSGGIPAYIQLASSNKFTMYDGTTEINIGGVLAPPYSTISKFASSWKTTSLAAYKDGTALGTGESSGSLNLGNNMAIGDEGDQATFLFGTIRNLRIYSVALSALQLTVLTT